MKSLFNMTGTEKAAALLIILGPEIASGILRHLDEDSIEKISAVMVKMQSLPVEEREDLVGEFIIELKKSSKSTAGGINRARKMIVDAFGEEKADELIKKIENRDTESGFKFLNELDDAMLVNLLKDEQPQIIALVIKFISPQKGGMVLKSLPPDRAREAGVKLARMNNPSAEAAVAVARALKKRCRDIKKIDDEKSIMGGVESLASIMSHMSSEQERNLLKGMDIVVPHLSKEIMEMIFTFENIVNLSNKEIRILIDEINDDFTIAKSLKGAGDDIKFKILRNMSQNRAEGVLTEMSAMGAVRLKDVEECRDYIVDIMRELNENGVILLRRDGEVYVE
jgi:flagellar motor switch protein FliG